MFQKLWVFFSLFFSLFACIVRIGIGRMANDGESTIIYSRFEDRERIDREKDERKPSFWPELTHFAYAIDDDIYAPVLEYMYIGGKDGCLAEASLCV